MFVTPCGWVNPFISFAQSSPQCKVLAQSPHLSAKPLHNSLPQLMHGTVLFFIDSSPFQTTIDSIFYCQWQMHAISLHPSSNISPQEECSLATFPIKVQKPYRERIKTAKKADTRSRVWKRPAIIDVP